MGSATYEAVAATRPRIRRDVLFTEIAEGVLFHNADGGFQLTAKSAYRFATLIVPHLTGDHSVSDLCEGLGDGQRAMVGELVKNLYERDFARPVERPEPADETPVAEGPGSADALSTEAAVARRYAPQIAYAEHYADDAEARFRRFRTARVAVLGDDLVARWCALGLIRNGCATVGTSPGLDAASRDAVQAEAAEAAADGCPVDLPILPADVPGTPLGWADLDGYDVVVVTGGAAAPRRLFPLLSAGVPEGRTLLPAWSYGGQAVVGPLTTSASTGCWACAVLRVGSRGSLDPREVQDAAAAAADLWHTVAVPGAEPVGERPNQPQSAMLGNLLGYEVFRLTTGALPAETAGNLVVQDMRSLDVSTEPLLPHPRCTVCASAGQETPVVVPVVDLTTAGTESLPLPTLATAREADALVEELNRRSVLVRPRAGVFTRFADEPLTQIPLKATLVEFGTGHGVSRRVAAFDVHHVAGARLRALDAAAEVYADHVVPDTGILTEDQLTAARAAGTRLLEPGTLTTALGLSADSAPLTAWRPATSLLTKEQVLVPAAAVRTFGPHNADRLFEATRAGTGAGATLADAAADGLLSALAHDALLRALRGDGPVRRVPLTVPETSDEAPGADAELTFLVRSAAVLGVDLDLLDLGESDRTGVHVLLARGAGTWAIGSETDRLGAAVAAVRDLLGQVQLAGEETAVAFDTGDPLLRDLDAATIDVTADATDGTDAPRVSGAEAVTVWADVLDRLRAAGRDALVVPTGSADLATAGIRTVRVLLTAEEARGA
ncbi:TOMM precursor leader peptide-binding protein [Streptomyces sp. NPDC058001]|uniref:TOMM precursor leader peptide-binding protein n=1 Tax=Streptomyces sp. NPDC058001 TaxID=3346300 RepID=UPI0036EB93B0